MEKYITEEKKKNNQVTKEDFLLDTIVYFGEDPKKKRSIAKAQAVGTTSTCLYSKRQTKYPEETEGCAIGRFLDNSISEIYDTIGSWEDIVEEIETNHIKDARPEWMKIISNDFLMDVQGLHDNHHAWDYSKNGLSDIGVPHVNNIIRKYNLHIKPADIVKLNLKLQKNYKNGEPTNREEEK